MRLDGDQWQRRLHGFERSAFRLETLPQYLVPQESDELRRFLAGEEPPEGLRAGWCEKVAAHIAAGKVMQRVHVLTSPLSDYLRYEFAWGYALTVEAGEDIRILDLAERPDPGLPDEDFWLFDDRVVVRMLYEPDGTQIGRELVDDPDLDTYRRWKQLALDHSVPFTRYYAKLSE